MKRKGKAHQSAESQVRKQRLKDIIRQELGGLIPHQVHDIRAMIDEHISQGVDIGYLKTVLFPEQFSYDIPFPLSSVSYCKFTNTQQVTISTGEQGSGMAIWYPRVQGGYQLMVLSITNPPGPNSTGIPFQTKVTKFYPSAANTNLSAWQLGLPQFSYANFTQTALVAGSMSVQYVGSIEQERGYMVGGHIFGVDPEKLTTDDIENAQWVTRARPGEGLRFLHLPKDESDYQFYPCSKGPSMNQGAGAVALFSNVINNQASDVVINMDVSVTTNTTPGANLPVSFSFCGSRSITGASVLNQDELTASLVTSGLSPSNIPYVRNSNFIAFYWQGLEPNSYAIRIDCVRKFCATPTSQTRDIVELVRPARSFDSKRTFDVLNALCNTAPIGGHTLKEISTTIEPLIRYLPNAGYILQNGGFAQVNSLAELVATLAGIDDEDKQLDGPLKPSLNRLYKLSL